jgi:hypothetical protein
MAVNKEDVARQKAIGRPITRKNENVETKTQIGSINYYLLFFI